MASLNLSINGASIKSSYAGVVNGNATFNTPTHCLWALFTIQAPLQNAFQDGGAKESVLKVESTGDGELTKLTEEFNDGRMQFAFVKVKDPNTALPKYILIAWCGEGVPERTKGYFTKHVATVSKLLHGYHVQITARSETDLEPATIMKKVADASGAKYSGGPVAGMAPPPPPVKSKPVFTPTSHGVARPVDPLIAARSQRDTNVDADGWGSNAPPVTRTQIEKVPSAYQPTKVNMAELTGRKSELSRPVGGSRQDETPSDVVKGGYQPVGKVDIAAIRAQAQKTGDDRPTPVKGAYEPVGKVDIAAIRAKARKPDDEPTVENKSLGERAAAFSDSQPGRLTSLPKPKVAKKFAGASAIMGTKTPAPLTEFGGPAAATATAPVAGTSRTFADEGGKTPAQIWAEKKAREKGESIGSVPVPSAAPVVQQKSGSAWKSGYTGKSWAPVQTGAATRPPQDAEFVTQQHTGEAAHQAPAEPESPARFDDLRDQFKNTVPISAAPMPIRSVEQEEEAPPPPPPPAGSRPTGGFQLPGLPSRPPPVDDEEEEDDASQFQPPAPPTPPAPAAEREQSPIRVTAPVSRGVLPLTEEPSEPQHVPAHDVHVHKEMDHHDEHEAQHTVDHVPVAPVQHGQGGARALVQYDYDKAEDNEIDLVEGQYVTNIDMVDDDWWLGTNAMGESGLFPSNYVELVEEGEEHEAAAAPPPPRAPEPEATHAIPHAPEPAASAHAGPTATAMYDYEAAEDNELSFPEDAKIMNLEFPDEDWWFGHYNGHSGLFPSNYVNLDA